MANRPRMTIGSRRTRFVDLDAPRGIGPEPDLPPAIIIRGPER